MLSQTPEETREDMRQQGLTALDFERALKVIKFMSEQEDDPSRTCILDDASEIIYSDMKEMTK